jgi:hypothetical protein
LAAVQTDVLPAVDIRAAVTKRALLRAGGAGGKAAAATSALFQAYGLDGSVEAWVHSARGPDHPSAPTSGVLPGQAELAAVKDHAGDTTGRDDAEVPVVILGHPCLGRFVGHAELVLHFLGGRGRDGLDELVKVRTSLTEAANHRHPEYFRAAMVRQSG